MSIFCKVYERLIIENESEYKKYITTLRKKNDKSLYKKYAPNKVDLDELEKMLNDYITSHKKNFDLNFINCEFKIEIDNNFPTDIETK